MTKRFVLALAAVSFSLTGSLLLSQAQTNLPSASPAGARQVGTSVESTKPCFKCNGTGQIKCPVCKNGQMDCPGSCLKLSREIWQHMTVAGHPPTDLWQEFYSSNGRPYGAWNQSHVGDVIEMQNGTPVNIGKCKICGGTGHVLCTKCQGTGIIVCDICDGKKVVPVSWTAFKNPKLKNPPSEFKLKDGRIIVGKITMSSQSSLWIRIETGETIKVEKADLQDAPPVGL